MIDLKNWMYGNILKYIEIYLNILRYIDRKFTAVVKDCRGTILLTLQAPEEH
jgi:hypothetical protein